MRRVSRLDIEIIELEEEIADACVHLNEVEDKAAEEVLNFGDSAARTRGERDSVRRKIRHMTAKLDELLGTEHVLA